MLRHPAENTLPGGYLTADCLRRDIDAGDDNEVHAFIEKGNTLINQRERAALTTETLHNMLKNLLVYRFGLFAGRYALAEAIQVVDPGELVYLIQRHDSGSMLTASNWPSHQARPAPACMPRCAPNLSSTGRAALPADGLSRHRRSARFRATSPHTPY